MDSKQIILQHLLKNKIEIHQILDLNAIIFRCDYGAFATLGYFCLGLSKLDPEVIMKLIQDQ